VEQFELGCDGGYAGLVCGLTAARFWLGNRVIRGLELKQIVPRGTICWRSGRAARGGRGKWLVARR